MTNQSLQEQNDQDNWLVATGAFFTQGSAFAAWQRAAGRTVIRETISDSSTTLYFQAVKYPLPLGLSYLYIPHGPVITGPGRPELLSSFHERLLAIGRQERAIFVRFDPWPATATADFSLVGRPVTGSALHSAFLQPAAEWLIDLRPELSTILAEFDKKTRYAIRRAEQSGVTIEIITDGLETYLETFYQLLRDTAERGHFSLHRRAYYEQVLRITNQRGDGFLVLARYHGEIIVASLIHCFGPRALYVFSGSSSDHRELNAPYLAQVATIEELKRRGSQTYSLGGIADSGDDPSGWQGLSRFKRHFPGHVFRFAPVRDLIIKPVWYYLYILRKWLKK